MDLVILVPDHRVPVTRRCSTLEDSRALDRFLASVERRAFRMAFIATGQEEDAHDLVQDAMLKLVERYAGCGEAGWAPLFHRILQSKIRDWYRRTKVRSRWRLWLGRGDESEEADDPLESIADTATPSVEHQVKTKQAAAALEEALRSLPLRQQQAFLLRAWEELDVAQTAAAMGCSEGSVKTHYFRAVQTLRKRLGSHWP
ncbi:RNA polymerase sigma factor [Nitrospira moscoviensis]